MRRTVLQVSKTNLFFHISDEENNELKPKYYTKQLQDITEDEAEAIIISHCYGARQMLEVAGYALRTWMN